MTDTTAARTDQGRRSSPSSSMRNGVAECPASLTWCQYGPACVGGYVACPTCHQATYVMVDMVMGGGLWARHTRPRAAVGSDQEPR